MEAIWAKISSLDRSNNKESVLAVMDSENRREDSHSVSVAVRSLLESGHARRQLETTTLEFFKATSQLPVSRLGYWERVFGYEVHAAMQPSGVFGLRLFQDRRQRLLISWLDCCSYNGYQREAALRALDEGAPNSFLFAIILRRLNDWVSELTTPRAKALSIRQKYVEALRGGHFNRQLREDIAV